MASALFPMFPAQDLRIDQLTWDDPAADPGAPEDAASRLRAAEQKYRTLVEQIPAVTFMAVLGEGKNEVYVSPHIEALLGYSQKEWLEDPFLWYTRLHPEDRALWNEEFTRGCLRGGPFRADCRFLARDGRVVWVHGEARIIKDDHGRPTLLQGVAFDITEVKQAHEVLIEQAIVTARQEELLAIAQRVQTSILPRKIAVPGLEIAARMIPASEVGGDYYDVLRVDDGCWIAIGDVSGHGLDAGLVMLMLQSAVLTSVLARAAGDAGRHPPPGQPGAGAQRARPAERARSRHPVAPALHAGRPHPVRRCPRGDDPGAQRDRRRGDGGHAGAVAGRAQRGGRAPRSTRSCSSTMATCSCSTPTASPRPATTAARCSTSTA